MKNIFSFQISLFLFTAMSNIPFNVALHKTCCFMCMNICSRSKQHSHRKLKTIIVMTPTPRLLIMTNVTSVTKNENLIHEVVYKIQENISNDVSLLKTKILQKNVALLLVFALYCVLPWFFCPGPTSLGPYENKTKQSVS